MDNERLIAEWHSRIQDICEGKLQRQMSAAEKNFVWRCSGFIALEMIQDTVIGMSMSELQTYLNSETDK